MQKSHKTFFVLSLVIAILEISFVSFTYLQQKNTLEEHLQEKIQQVRSSFDLALLSSRQRMSELAGYVANSPAIQQAFLAGKKAIIKEGGGAGGSESAAARAKLLSLSQKSWQQLNSSFDFRQMHYHLPSPPTSFLRVHKPEKYGDDLSPLRHMLVTANEKRQLVSGFESGRSQSGLRGVSPVFAYDSETEQPIYVGTLEFATSLEQTLVTLAENQGVDLAVLLSVEELGKIAWPDNLRQRTLEKGAVDGFLIETASFPQAKRILQEEDVRDLFISETMDLHVDKTGYHWLASFPLRDFGGDQDLQRPAVGKVIISRDATKSVQALHRNLANNIMLALTGFIFIEILLFMGMQVTTRALERIVQKGREEVESQNRILADELQQKEQLQQQREALIEELLAAMEDVKALSGLLPICAYCKKIRDDDGYWRRLETFIESHSSAQFSHGICHDCMEKHYPEEADSCCSHLVEGTLRPK